MTQNTSYNGWIIIDKPLGMSSAQAVNKVKWLLKSKVGHAGTLDPLATGVLPIAVGEATKLMQYSLDSDKEYEFEATWGEERSTDDAEGKVVASSEIRVSREQILAVMEKFKGEIEQVPPIFSAIKVDGQRSYDLARAGGDIELKPRKLVIHSLDLLETQNSELKTSFKMHCSKGTYVRSIVRDMGRELGCFAYVSKLKRTLHGQFGISSAISLETLAELCEKDLVSQALLPVEVALDGIPALPLSELEEKRIRNGLPISNPGNLSAEVILLKRNEKLVAIAFPQNSELWPKRVFNY